ncbi:MAG: hypothetical protein HKN03_10025 [Acidimicrobiales bacterium]|nr:hypothetical protein [Acidimicrobiales bacterium]
MSSSTQISRAYRSIRSIVNLQTVVVTVLACLSTWTCRRLEWTGDFPLTLVGTAVIFPIVFSIGGAYKRREAALDDYGAIKAHGRAIYFATRDWFPDTNEHLQADVRARLFELLDSCRTLFVNPVSEMPIHEPRVYAAFSDLSLFINGLRDRGLPSGEASRCNQFLSKMMISFEHIKHVYQYRTPLTLRTYSKVFIYVLPVIYGPYFAYEAENFATELTFVMPILLSVILVSLDNIQEHLEDPFDQVGEDDVMINAEKFIERLLDEGQSSQRLAV